MVDWTVSGGYRSAWVWFWQAPRYLKSGYRLDRAVGLRWKISTIWYPGLGLRNFL
jgi:hypothetical protein